MGPANSPYTLRAWSGKAQPSEWMISVGGPTFNVADLVEQGLLETCLEPFMAENPGFFLYFPSRAQMLPKLRGFLDFWAETRPLTEFQELPRMLRPAGPVTS